MNYRNKISLAVATFLLLFLEISLVAMRFMERGVTKGFTTYPPLSGDNSRQLYLRSYFSEVFPWPWFIMIVLALTLYIILFIFYAKHILTHRPRKQLPAALWILSFVIVGPIAFTAYFFVRVAQLQAASGENTGGG